MDKVLQITDEMLEAAMTTAADPRFQAGIQHVITSGLWQAYMEGSRKEIAGRVHKKEIAPELATCTLINCGFAVGLALGLVQGVQNPAEAFREG
jgi:hypothetical protein